MPITTKILNVSMMVDDLISGTIEKVSRGHGIEFGIAAPYLFADLFGGVVVKCSRSNDYVELNGVKYAISTQKRVKDAYSRSLSLGKDRANKGRVPKNADRLIHVQVSGGLMSFTEYGMEDWEADKPVGTQFSPDMVMNTMMQTRVGFVVIHHGLYKELRIVGKQVNGLRAKYFGGEAFDGSGNSHGYVVKDGKTIQTSTGKVPECFVRSGDKGARRGEGGAEMKAGDVYEHFEFDFSKSGAESLTITTYTPEEMKTLVFG